MYMYKGPLIKILCTVPLGICLTALFLQGRAQRRVEYVTRMQPKHSRLTSSQSTGLWPSHNASVTALYPSLTERLSEYAPEVFASHTRSACGEKPQPAPRYSTTAGKSASSPLKTKQSAIPTVQPRTRKAASARANTTENAGDSACPESSWYHQIIAQALPPIPPHVRLDIPAELPAEACQTSSTNKQQDTGAMESEVLESQLAILKPSDIPRRPVFRRWHSYAFAKSRRSTEACISSKPKSAEEINSSFSAFQKAMAVVLQEKRDSHRKAIMRLYKEIPPGSPTALSIKERKSKRKARRAPVSSNEDRQLPETEPTKPVYGPSSSAAAGIVIRLREGALDSPGIYGISGNKEEESAYYPCNMKDFSPCSTLSSREETLAASSSNILYTNGTILRGMLLHSSSLPTIFERSESEDPNKQEQSQKTRSIDTNTRTTTLHRDIYNISSIYESDSNTSQSSSSCEKEGWAKKIEAEKENMPVTQAITKLTSEEQSPTYKTYSSNAMQHPRGKEQIRKLRKEKGYMAMTIAAKQKIRPKYVPGEPTG